MYKVSDYLEGADIQKKIVDKLRDISTVVLSLHKSKIGVMKEILEKLEAIL